MLQKNLPFPGDPFTVFKKFYGLPGLFFLDSSQKGAEGRFSYIGFLPFKTITGHDFAALKREIKTHQVSRRDRFCGGAVGYVAYEGKLNFGLYDRVLAFDHRRRELCIHAPDTRAMDEICAQLKENLRPSVSKPGPCPIVFQSNFTKASYVAAVKKALRHIRAGDIYQINLSRRVDTLIPGRPKQPTDLAALYGALRAHSPSPFAAYFEGQGQTVLSSSPERFFKLSGRLVQVKPMKGTRPRGNTPAKDKQLEQDLRHSPKEIAELLMVTDLERNDLGRVCDYGSVKVTSMRTIEAYRTVFQATATVEGRLHKKFDGFDALRATFPGGSVTGCPKIEAMRIIQLIERAPRGPYTGALGYIDFGGDMDFSILIRALFVRPGRLSFHVGGGIVADSVPEAEYEETVLKARGMEAALAEVYGR